MPNIHELIDNVAVQISKNLPGRFGLATWIWKMHTANLNCAKNRVSNVTSVFWAAKQRERIGF